MAPTPKTANRTATAPRPIPTRTRGSRPTSRKSSAPRSKASPSTRKAPRRRSSGWWTRIRKRSASSARSASAAMPISRHGSAEPVHHDARPARAQAVLAQPDRDLSRAVSPRRPCSTARCGRAPGLTPFAVAQAALLWAWLAVHIKRLRDAGQGPAGAIGVAVIYALALGAAADAGRVPDQSERRTGRRGRTVRGRCRVRADAGDHHFRAAVLARLRHVHDDPEGAGLHRLPAGAGLARVLAHHRARQSVAPPAP